MKKVKYNSNTKIYYDNKSIELAKKWIKNLNDNNKKLWDKIKNKDNKYVELLNKYNNIKVMYDKALENFEILNMRIDNFEKSTDKSEVVINEMILEL